MKKLRLNSITWHTDNEGLLPVLESVKPGETGRRGYAVVEHQGKRLFIKTFVEGGLSGFLRNMLSPRGEKEYRMGTYLLSHGIATPQPLGYGIARRNSFIITEQIEGESFWSLWQKGKNREVLLNSLADLLMGLKEHGIRHDDLHLENIIISNDKLHLIDLHSMKIKKDFGAGDEVSNLTHALAMIYGGMDNKERGLFFRAYSANGAAGLQALVEKAIGKQLLHWIAGKKNRALRNTSKAHWDGVFLRIRGSDGKGRGEAPVAVLKKDKKVFVERCDDHIRKTYRHKRRLIKAWKNHIVLTYMESPLAPQAYFFRKAGLFRPGYIAMEDLSPLGVELDRFIDANFYSMDSASKKTFIRNLAKFFRTAIDSAILHKDLKACNVFVLNDGTFRFLDIEDIAFGTIDDGLLTKMLVQLNTTVPVRIPAKDRIRFFLALCHGLDIAKKGVFREALRLSLEQEIVYEGISGLKIESWHK